MASLHKLISQRVREQKVQLTEEQIEMLKMSDQDLKNGHILSQKELFDRERQWLSEP